MGEVAGKSILRFEEVTVVFDDLKTGEPRTVLDKVSFDVREGETRIIFGAAASGKRRCCTDLYRGR